jgi:hypothetical protein
MREVKEIVKEIKETEKVAVINTNDLPYASRGGMGIAVRTACEKLPVLLDELKATIIPTKLVAVFAVGPDAITNKVAAFLEENGGLVVDANGLYRGIAKAIEPTYGADRTFGVQQFGVMMREIRDLAGSLGYDELPAPQFDGNTSVLCRDEYQTSMHVREIIRKSIGDDFSRKFIVKNLTESVIKGAVDGRRIPILVLDTPTAEEKAALTVLFSSSTTYKFETDFTVDKQSISKIFKSSNPQKGDGAVTGDKEKGE